MKKASKKQAAGLQAMIVVVLALIRGCVWAIVRVWVLATTRPLHEGAALEKAYKEIHERGYEIVKAGLGSANGSPSAAGMRISRFAAGMVGVILSLEALGYQITRQGRPVTSVTGGSNLAPPVEGKYLKLSTTGPTGLPQMLLRGESGVLVATGSDLARKASKAALVPGDHVRILHTGWSQTGARIFEIEKVRVQRARRAAQLAGAGHSAGASPVADDVYHVDLDDVG